MDVRVVGDNLPEPAIAPELLLPTVAAAFCFSMVQSNV